MKTTTQQHEDGPAEPVVLGMPRPQARTLEKMGRASVLEFIAGYMRGRGRRVAPPARTTTTREG